MNPENMDQEQLRRLEISRAKSDEDLLDAGATYSDKVAENGPRLDLDSSRFHLHAHLSREGEVAIERITNLEGKEFERDMKDFVANVQAHESVYRKVSDVMRSDTRALMEFGKNVRDGHVVDANAIVERLKMDNDFSPYEWQMAMLVVNAAKSLTKKYVLIVPVFEGMKEDEIITNLESKSLVHMIEQARAEVLLRKKGILGK
jgi:hypothetical protein